MSKPFADRKVDNPDDEFGVSASAATTDGAAVGERGKGKGKEEDAELEFLDYVTCSIW
jgi:hypothetical protein